MVHHMIMFKRSSVDWLRLYFVKPQNLMKTLLVRFASHVWTNIGCVVHRNCTFFTAGQMGVLHQEQKKKELIETLKQFAFLLP